MAPPKNSWANETERSRLLQFEKGVYVSFLEPHFVGEYKEKFSGVKCISKKKKKKVMTLLVSEFCPIIRSHTLDDRIKLDLNEFKEICQCVGDLRHMC